MALQLILFFCHLYQLLIESTLNKVAIVIFYVLGRRIGIESVYNHENPFSVIFVETPPKCIPVCTESDFVIHIELVLPQYGSQVFAVLQLKNFMLIYLLMSFGA